MLGTFMVDMVTRDSRRRQLLRIILMRFFCSWLISGAASDGLGADRDPLPSESPMLRPDAERSSVPRLLVRERPSCAQLVSDAEAPREASDWGSSSSMLALRTMGVDFGAGSSATPGNVPRVRGRVVDDVESLRCRGAAWW